MKKLIKKLVCCLLALVLSLIFCSAGCQTSTNPSYGSSSEDEKEKTLDARLVGGKWAHITTSFTEYDISQGYYKFYSKPGRQMLAHQTSLCNIFGTNDGQNFSPRVYSIKDKKNKNKGIIYSGENDGRPPYGEYKLMEYEFHKKYPYENTSTLFISNENRAKYDKLCADGNLITYHLYNKDGTLFDDGRYYYRWVLIRFPDPDD